MKSILIIVVGCLSLQFSIAQSVFWKVTDTKGKKQMHILGTSHWMQNTDYYWPAKVNQSFLDAKTVVMETETDEFDSLFLIARSYVLQGLTIDSLLTETRKNELYPWFDAYLGESWRKTKNLSPLFFHSAFYEKIISNRGISHETRMYPAVKKHEKEVKPLVGAKEKYNFNKSITLTKQTNTLIQLYQQREKEVAWFHEFQGWYYQGELDSIATLYRTKSVQFNGLQPNFIQTNIDNWTPKLIQFINKDKKVFTAIHAAYLGGPMGILAKLKQAGYIVEPVKI